MFVIFYERAMRRDTGFQFNCDDKGVINEWGLTAKQRTALMECRANVHGEFLPPKVMYVEDQT